MFYTHYYAAVLASLPPICYHCGLGEDCLVNNEYIQELKQKFAVVSPICFMCYRNLGIFHC